ncbi:alpha/beta hydrolase [Streptomyces sp. NPDC048567]|uniref:alpha/beta hydrolase n=1 Tax=Streptomyces sp. NPDC048567 TaxID=3365570 RepID=UPI003717153F
MATSRVPVVFIHGLWLHSSSWEPWMDLFTERGFDPIAPLWPGEAPTVAETRRQAENVAGYGIDEITGHYAQVVKSLDAEPVIVGHSFGGLITQKLLSLGLGRAGVAIDPAQIKGVKPLPFSQLRSGFPVLKNPANKKKAVSLTAKQFRYAFGNAIPENESNRLFEEYTIPSPGRPLFEAAFANFSRKSPASVNTANPTRGPLLLISGQKDHTAPDAVTRAAYALHAASPASTDLRQFADRGHSLTVDDGWKGIADYVLEWLSTKGVQGRAGMVD